ncbi:MAG: XRE family transcriptional regulator [Granulosicoccus sp.]|nr:XRE family transcriptional regulator [Granulosicoccus sp.]
MALRSLRETQGLTARQLAERAGISAAMISRIENAQVSPSIATMTSLTNALDVPLASLFRDTRAARADFTHVTRGDGIVSTRLLGDHIHHYVNLALHRRRDLNFEAHLITVRKQPAPPPHYVSHGVVFMHVLQGSARYQYGKHSLMLVEGDSLSIDAELSHGIGELLSDEFVFLSVQAESRR